MKNKTLLEAATDMLLNRPQSTVSENISPSVLETLDLLSLHKILDKAFDVVGEKYSEVIDDDSDIEHDFRALSSDIDDLLDMTADNKLKTIPNIKEDEALDITGAVLEEISARCESIYKLCNGILRDSYTDFNSTVMNVFGESTDKEELEESNPQNAPYGIPYPKFKHDYDDHIGHQELSVIALMTKGDKQKLIKWINDHMNTEYSYYGEDLKEGSEMDDIAAKVAELKVGDKTNFGVVVDKSSNSVTFKGKDLPKTKITFNQRKMGSRDYVLSALRKIN